MNHHQCIINIDNSKNPAPLVLNSIAGPDGTGNAEGKFSEDITVGTTIAPGASLNFILTGGVFETAGATLTWTTGSGGTQAVIAMTFQNKSLLLIPDNNAGLMVTASQSDTSGLLAYGVSHFYASEGGDKPMARDYINNCGSHSPVYVNYTVAFNAFVTNPPASPFLPGITNVVMLMLENRSLDNLLGQIYTSYDPVHVFPAGSSPVFDGLGQYPRFSNTYKGKTVTANPVPKKKCDVPNPDPGEQWNDVNQQLFNKKNPHSIPKPDEIPDMGGFLANYHAQKHVKSHHDQIMQFYPPDGLPVLSKLATSYAVSDAWHCSVPSQTSPNRAFSVAGTSNGYVDNYSKPGSDPLDIVEFKMRTIFNVLNNCGKNDWAIYWQQHILQPLPLTAEIFPQVRKLTDDLPSGRQHIDVFFDTIDKGGTLPAFCYLEPVFMPEPDVPASDYHPPHNVYPGEQNLAKIYNALTTYKDWNTTLFIVTFDEHGGTADHVPPSWGAVPPDEMTDWSKFGFDRFGVRVPTLLISPMIKEGTVFRSHGDIPFDHTSFVKTILGWQGIDVSGGVMGKRAVKAPDFSGVLSAKPVNTETVKLEPAECKSSDTDWLLNDLQKFLMAILARNIFEGIFGSDEHKQWLAELDSKSNIEELIDYVKKGVERK